MRERKSLGQSFASPRSHSPSFPLSPHPPTCARQPASADGPCSDNNLTRFRSTVNYDHCLAPCILSSFPVSEPCLLTPGSLRLSAQPVTSTPPTAREAPPLALTVQSLPPFTPQGSGLCSPVQPCPPFRILFLDYHFHVILTETTPHLQAREFFRLDKVNPLAGSHVACLTGASCTLSLQRTVLQCQNPNIACALRRSQD